jgi:hypothetical protein
MGSKDLKEEILEAFLVALDEANNLFKRNGPLAPEDHDTQIRKDTNTSRSRGGYSRDRRSRELRKEIQKRIASSPKVSPKQADKTNPNRFGAGTGVGARKPIAWGREGGVEGRDREEYARRVAKRQGLDFHGFDLESPKTDITGDLGQTTIGRRLARQSGGMAGAEGKRSSFLAGQGDKENAQPTPRGDKYLRGQGVDPDDPEDMLAANFEDEKGRHYKSKGERGKTEVGAGQETINKYRRMGQRRTMAGQEGQGRHVAGTIGSGHSEKKQSPPPKFSTRGQNRFGAGVKEQFKNAVLNYLNEVNARDDTNTAKR